MSSEKFNRRPMDDNSNRKSNSNIVENEVNKLFKETLSSPWMYCITNYIYIINFINQVKVFFKYAKK